MLEFIKRYKKKHEIELDNDNKQNLEDMIIGEQKVDGEFIQGKKL